MKTMLSRRLAAHSRQKVQSLASIVELGRRVDIDDLVVRMSGGSPRDIIRIGKAILDQQGEIDSSGRAISERAVSAGIEVIAAEIAAETVPDNILRDLKKMKRADFTVANVYADVFKITQGAGAQKVQLWQRFRSRDKDRQSPTEKRKPAQQRLCSRFTNCSKAHLQRHQCP